MQGSTSQARQAILLASASATPVSFPSRLVPLVAILRQQGYKRHKRDVIQNHRGPGGLHYRRISRVGHSQTSRSSYATHSAHLSECNARLITLKPHHELAHSCYGERYGDHSRRRRSPQLWFDLWTGNIGGVYSNLHHRRCLRCNFRLDQEQIP